MQSQPFVQITRNSVTNAEFITYDQFKIALNLAAYLQTNKNAVITPELAESVSGLVPDIDGINCVNECNRRISISSKRSNEGQIRDEKLSLPSGYMPASCENVSQEVQRRKYSKFNPKGFQWLLDLDRVKVTELTERGGVIIKHINYLVESQVKSCLYGSHLGVVYGRENNKKIQRLCVAS